MEGFQVGQGAEVTDGVAVEVEVGEGGEFGEGAEVVHNPFERKVEAFDFCEVFGGEFAFRLVQFKSDGALDGGGVVLGGEGVFAVEAATADQPKRGKGDEQRANQFHVPILRSPGAASTTCE